MNHEQRIAELEKELAKVKGEKPRPSEPWQKYDPTAQMTMPASALAAMVAAVPDRLVADIVGDARRQSALKPLNPDTPKPQQKGTGWRDETGFPDRTHDFELMDRIVESQVGGPNDTSKLKPR